VDIFAASLEQPFDVGFVALREVAGILSENPKSGVASVQLASQGVSLVVLVRLVLDKFDVGVGFELLLGLFKRTKDGRMGSNDAARR
jgi:hypothetical protein